MVELIERLVAQGREIRVFDPLVDPAAMTGANRAFALAHLPHVARLVLPTLEPIERAEPLWIGYLGRAKRGSSRRAPGRAGSSTARAATSAWTRCRATRGSGWQYARSGARSVASGRTGRFSVPLTSPTACSAATASSRLSDRMVTNW